MKLKHNPQISQILLQFLQEIILERYSWDYKEKVQSNRKLKIDIKCLTLLINKLLDIIFFFFLMFCLYMEWNVKAKQIVVHYLLLDWYEK